MNKRTAVLVLLAIVSGVILVVGDRWLGHNVCDQCRLGPPLPIRNADAIVDIVKRLCTDGRQSYLLFLWTFDLVGPLLYGGFFYLAISLTAANACPATARPARLRWIAIAAAVSDYIENGLTTALLLADPPKYRLWAALCAVATPLKWGLYGAAGAVVLVSLMAIGISRLRASPDTQRG
jgi:hypothetical protein